MNMKNLIEAVCAEANLPKNEADRLIHIVLDCAVDGLMKDKRLVLVNYLTVHTKEMAPRAGRNPRNPDMVVSIPAKTKFVFRPAKRLTNALNENEES